MSLWSPSSWTKKGVADGVEFFFAATSAALAPWVTLAKQADKTTPAVLLGVSAFLTLVAKYASRTLEQREKASGEAHVRSLAARAVQAILAKMQEYYFADEAGDERYKHRVTLFKCVEDAARGKHLAIFSRVGVRLDSQCFWRLDDNHPDGCRGVAGKIWYHNITDIKIAACDWPKDGEPALKARYAQSLDITVAEAEALNVKSRAFAGAPVMVSGRKWGVLLLDSLKDGFITDSPHKKGLLNRYTELVGRVLTEVLS